MTDHLDLDPILKRIADCSTYNFGMYNANKLAKEDAAAMAREISTLRLQLYFARTVQPILEGNNYRKVVEALEEYRDALRDIRLEERLQVTSSVVLDLTDILEVE